MITIQAGYAVVVDDEPANRDFVERLLQTAGFKVSGASTGSEALAAAKAVPTLALALVDQELPDASGLSIIKKLRADNPEALLVMATMHDHRSLIDEAFAAGVDVFLVKPHGFMELYRRLQEVDANTTLLRQLIIDQYGPRPYKGIKRPTETTAVAKPHTPTVTTPTAATTTSTHAAPPEVKATPVPQVTTTGASTTATPAGPEIKTSPTPQVTKPLIAPSNVKPVDTLSPTNGPVERKLEP